MCEKTWMEFDIYSNAILGRSHRSKKALSRIQEVIDLTKFLLEIPDDYYVGIVPASDTGAIEMLLWSLLGEKTDRSFSLGKFW